MTRGVTARTALALGALGVVFGDIGTSPIYTVQTVFNPDDPHPVAATRRLVFGVVSLIFWAVTIIVTDHLRPARHARGQRRRGRDHGAHHADPAEGTPRRPARRSSRSRARRVRGVALLRRQHDHPGDLGALGGRGVKVVAPSLSDLVVPITAVIIVLLFLLQRLGTATVGRCSGR